MRAVGCNFLHAEQKPEQLLYVPPGYMQWESIGDPSHAMRFGDLFRLSIGETIDLQLMADQMENDEEFGKDAFAVARDMLDKFGSQNANGGTATPVSAPAT